MDDPRIARANRAELLLGTLVDIRAEAPSPAVLERALAAAFAAIARVHLALSGQDPSSELSCVNRDAWRGVRRVSADFRAVLECALDVASRSGGTFDPTLGVYRASIAHEERAVVLQSPRASWRDVELGPRGVRYRRPLSLDFDGIAKGYAVDCAIDALREQGARAGRVNAGGDLRMFGYAPEPVHVRTGGPQGVVMPLAEVVDAAVATSAYGDQRRHVRRRWVTALIDPRTSMPILSARTVSVIASTCMLADALTKVVALRGRDAMSLLRAYDAAAAILSPAAGRWRCTLLSQQSPVALTLAA